MSDLDRTDDASPRPESDAMRNPATEPDVADPQGVDTTPQTTPEPVTLSPSDPAVSDDRPDQDPVLGEEDQATGPSGDQSEDVQSANSHPEDEQPVEDNAQPEAVEPPVEQSEGTTGELVETAQPAETTQPAQAPQAAENPEVAEAVKATPNTPNTPNTPDVSDPVTGLVTDPAAVRKTAPKEPLDMWAVVRDSDTAHPQSSPTNSTAQRPAASLQPEPPVLTGEEIQMTPPESTEGIVGEPLNHELETSAIEPVTTSGGESTHAIPHLLPDEGELDAANGQAPAEPAVASAETWDNPAASATTPAGAGPATAASHLAAPGTTRTGTSPAESVADTTTDAATNTTETLPSALGTQAQADSNGAGEAASEQANVAASISGPSATASAAALAGMAGASASSDAALPTPEAVESTNQGQAFDNVPRPGDDAALDRTAVRRRSLITPAGQPEPEPEASWRPRETVSEDHTVTQTPDRFDSEVFAGATVVPTVPKRGKWHALSILFTLILVPLMWYAAVDAAARFTLNIGYIVDGTVVDLTQRLIPVGELVGVIVALALIVECAIRSSVGAHVIGILVTLIGMPWVLVPDFTADTIYPLMESAFTRGAFLQNLGYHLQTSGYSGKLLLLGLVILAFGAISHRVRRRGRSEQAIRTQVEQMTAAKASAESAQ